MLNTDARASAFVTWLDDLEGDARLKKQDRDFLTAMKTKLGSEPTTRREDAMILAIHERFFSKIRY